MGFSFDYKWFWGLGLRVSPEPSEPPRWKVAHALVVLSNCETSLVRYCVLLFLCVVARKVTKWFRMLIAETIETV